MKRIVTLVLAFVLVLALASIASADEVEKNGHVYTWSVSEKNPTKVWSDGDTLTDADFNITFERDGAPYSDYTATVVDGTIALGTSDYIGEQAVSVRLEDNEYAGTPLGQKVFGIKAARTLSSITVSPTAIAYIGDTPSDLIISVKADFASLSNVDLTGSEYVSFPMNDPFTVKGTQTVDVVVTVGSSSNTKSGQVAVTVKGLLEPTLQINNIGDVYVDESTSVGCDVVATITIGGSPFTTVVNDDATFSPETYTSTSSTNVDVSYTYKNGETATGSFTVTPKEKCTAIAVSDEVTEAFVDDAPSATVTATISGSSEDVTSKATFEPATFTSAGSVTVTAKYKHSEHATEQTATFTVTVKEKPDLKASSPYDKDSGKIVLVGDPIDETVFDVQFEGKNVFSKCKMEPDIKNFNTPGEQVFTFRYHDPNTNMDYVKKVTMDVKEPIEKFEVTGTPSGNFAGKVFDPELMTGLKYSVTFRTSDITGAKLEGDIVDSSDWKHERISYQPKGMKLKFGIENNEITFVYTHPSMSHALYFTKTISGLSVIDSITVGGASPMFFDGATFRDDLLRSIDKVGVSIEIKFVPEAGKSDIVITSSKDPNLTQIDIPNTKLENGKPVTGEVTYTDPESGSWIKSATITANPVMMEYYDTTTTTDKALWPQWKGSLSKTGYSVGQKIDSTGVSLILTNYWGEKVIITNAFQYDYRTKKNGTNPAFYDPVDINLPSRELKLTDDRIRFHCWFPKLGGAWADAAYDNALLPSGKIGTLESNITVNTRTLSRIEITTAPDKLTYEIGEIFDTTGMVVTAVYGNGTTEKVNTYTFAPNTAFTKDDVGSKIVTISYTADLVTKTANVIITVNGPAVPSMSVVLNKASLSLIQTQTSELAATVYPKDASNKNVTWSSSNETVAKVNDKGVVEAVGGGTCLITATTCDYTHRYADCFVTVQPKTAVTKLTLQYSSLELLRGDATTIAAAVTPENATITEIKWETSDASICSVNENGQVKGLKVGDAIISATADGVTAKMAVSVVNSLSYTGTVVNCKKSVNVRDSASNGGKVIGTARKGSKFKVLDESGSWYKIQYTSSKTGWIYKDYLSLSSRRYTVDSSEVANTANTSTGNTTIYATKLTIINCTRYCYVRKGPSTSTSSLGHANANATYDLLGVSGDWYIINFNGSQGYVYKTFAQLS